MILLIDIYGMLIQSEYSGDNSHNMTAEQENNMF